jgi:hypothetical protein
MIGYRLYLFVPQYLRRDNTAPVHKSLLCTITLPPDLEIARWSSAQAHSGA